MIIVIPLVDSLCWTQQLSLKMPHFARPPSLLKKISEDSDDSDEMPQPLDSVRRITGHPRSNIGSWKDGFDTFEDYHVPGTGVGSKGCFYL